MRCGNAIDVYLLGAVKIRTQQTNIHHSHRLHEMQFELHRNISTNNNRTRATECHPLERDAVARRHNNLAFLRTHY